MGHQDFDSGRLGLGITDIDGGWDALADWQRGRAEYFRLQNEAESAQRQKQRDRDRDSTVSVSSITDTHSGSNLSVKHISTGNGPTTTAPINNNSSSVSYFSVRLGLIGSGLIAAAVAVGFLGFKAMDYLSERAKLKEIERNIDDLNSNPFTIFLGNPFNIIAATISHDNSASTIFNVASYTDSVTGFEYASDLDLSDYKHYKVDFIPAASSAVLFDSTEYVPSQLTGVSIDGTRVERVCPQGVLSTIFAIQSSFDLTQPMAVYDASASRWADGARRSFNLIPNGAEEISGQVSQGTWSFVMQQPQQPPVTVCAGTYTATGIPAPKP